MYVYMTADHKSDLFSIKLPTLTC